MNKFRVMPFPGGGCVVHGIEGQRGARLSAWFDKHGELIDCEGYSRNGRAFVPGASVRADLAPRGQRFLAWSLKS